MWWIKFQSPSVLSFDCISNSRWWGNHWLRVASIGNHWLCLKTIGNHWLCSATIGNNWEQLATIANYWQRLASPGNNCNYCQQLQLLATFGNNWLHLATLGDQWFCPLLMSMAGTFAMFLDKLFCFMFWWQGIIIQNSGKKSNRWMVIVGDFECMVKLHEGNLNI